MPHNGQWLGTIDGDAPGSAVLELDERNGGLEGIAYHFPNDLNAPGAAVYLVGIAMGSKAIEVECPLIPIDPANGFWLTRDQMAERFPDYQLADTAKLSIKFNDFTADVEYSTNITKGSGKLGMSGAHLPSELKPLAEIDSWAAFRNWAFEQKQGGAIYRGQPRDTRLRTSFHRTKRKNLARFRDDDINQLRLALAPRLRHVFNAENPHETGAFYNLAQHHGYPTPLLDWTYSTFVAAFFAYRQKPGTRAAQEKVRIYEFAKRDWESRMRSSSLTAYARPHFSVIALLAIENPRAIPQQATATITNLDDIEEYVRHFEDVHAQTYLRAIDLPLADRDEALADLSLMGITAGSLFPGLDGACEALAAANFGF